MLYRIAVECWLYNLATLSIFCRDCDKIVGNIDWAIIDRTFEGVLNAEDLALHTSPFLGGTHGIYKLILQLTWFARQDFPIEFRRSQTASWSANLDALERRLNTYYQQVPWETAELYHTKFLVHIYALRVFLAKVADHRIPASSPTIQFFVHKAQHLIETRPTYEFRNPALAWPLIIFLCTTDRQPSFQFFRSTIMDISDNFDEGHTKRINAVLDALLESRSATASIETNEEGFDLLLRKQGILYRDENTPVPLDMSKKSRLQRSELERS